MTPQPGVEKPMRRFTTTTRAAHDAWMTKVAGTPPATPVVVDSMFVAIGELFEKRMSASVEWQGDEFLIGYREGRDVCVIARGKTWEEALAQATDRVYLVDRLLRDTSTNNAAVATAAAVPVRFVRIRRRDVATPGAPRRTPRNPG